VTAGDLEVVSTGFSLAESPRWHPTLGVLSWIDITTGAFWRQGGPNGTTSTSFDAPLGAALPAVDGWLIATGSRLVHLPVSGAVTTYASAATANGTRFNDGTCDRRGRALLGTMDLGFRAPVGALSVWSKGRARTLKRGMAISNGVGWSPDGAGLYLADTTARVLWRAEYDHDAGAARDWEPWDLRFLPGKPDGLCVDEEGAVWVALWDGGAIARIRPDGSVDRILPVPAAFVSSCCFGGRDLDRLYITTAESAPQRRDGALLVGEVGVRGCSPPLWDPRA